MCSDCVVPGDSCQKKVWRKFGFFTDFYFVSSLLWVRCLFLLFYTQVVHLILPNQKQRFSSFTSSFSTFSPTLSTKPTLLNKTLLVI